MGAATPLDAFTFAFEETEWGVFIAHAYQYQFRQHRSTWVFETDAETFDKAGLGAMSEEESAKFMERIFARHLDGHPVLTNRSLWRNFPMIRNQRWVKDNIVLLGDAKSTAHFSIGAGTKLAMEDAIALYEAFVSEGGVEDSLARVRDRRRRDEVERTQHSADVSLVFFEHIRRFWDFDPAQFAFGVMTRSKAITYDNLRLRAPDFVDTVDRHFAGTVRRAGLRRRRSSIPCRRCSSRSGSATWCSGTASWSRRCACTRRRTACPATGISSTTGRGRSAAPGCSSPR